MRLHRSIGFAAILLACAPGIYADETLSDQKEQLDNKILKMETLIATMEGESDGWKLRSSMQEHAQIMEDSASLATKIAEAEYSERANCLEKAANREDFEVCYGPDNIRDSQYRLLVALMRHAIYRQNIIMEKAGIFK